jgi:MFS transporter, NNP family, nitrate/nitrite transporter
MDGRATRLELLSFSSIPMRAFHLTWMAFFVCFFAWFAVAPLLPVIREDLGLTKDQIANIGIAAVCVTIFVRLLIGPLCDRFDARRFATQSRGLISDRRRRSVRNYAPARTAVRVRRKSGCC